jgi:enoyl-CoA hydratase/carnithine racemase
MTAGDEALVRVELGSGLAVLTIDAPPLNLYTAELQEQLSAAIGLLEQDKPRAALIRAEGTIVSGGVDVSLFDAKSNVAEAKALFDVMLSVPNRIAALPFPTVFAAHGLCLTWAFEVAVACDLIVAAERAKFGLVERVVGLTPAMGGTQRLAARAGVSRAKELVMTGATYGAETMERWNVVNKVYPNDAFDSYARAFATDLAEGPTQAHKATKRVLDHFMHGGVPEANEHITTIAADLFTTEDLRNAVQSFLTEGPGKATFTGR